MNLSDDEKHAVLSVLKLYRSWMYHTVKDAEDSLQHPGKSYLVGTLAKLTSAQKKIEQSLEHKADQAPTSVSHLQVGKNEARVLIADDDEISTELIRSMLEDTGFTHVEIAHDGEEALVRLQTANPPFHMLISDWRMPKLTGLELHEKANAEGLLEHTAFVLLTAVADDVLASRAEKQGIRHYLTKPMEVDEFDATINRLFKAD